MAKRRTKKDPKDTSYLKWEILGRTIVKHTEYDEHIVTQKKICVGNPAETFETVETVCYRIEKTVEKPPAVKKIAKKKSVVQKVKEAVTPKRARNKKGQLVADDPNTPENEAWEGGVAPPKKKTTTKKRKKS